jgi:hypothetical protein
MALKAGHAAEKAFLNDLRSLKSVVFTHQIGLRANRYMREQLLNK